MKMETPTQAARRICPNWMSPIGDAHYRDVLAALQNQHNLGLSVAADVADDYSKNCSTGDMGEIAAKTIARAIRSNMTEVAKKNRVVLLCRACGEKYTKDHESHCIFKTNLNHDNRRG